MKLRITTTGEVPGLWTDEIDWARLGRSTVRRASHVELCRQTQCWQVRAVRPERWHRRFLQTVLGRPFGKVLHAAATRSNALAWERAFFSPGGPGWDS
jgi:hypothetical protein